MRALFLLTTLSLGLAFSASSEGLTAREQAVLERGQYVIHFVDAEGKPHTGMGFPTLNGKIFTAAHIFPKGKAGDLIQLGINNGIGQKITWHKGKIKQLVLLDDMAIVELTDQAKLLPSLPQCDALPVSGAELVVYKPILGNDVVISSRSFRVFVTHLKGMPKIVVSADELAPETLTSLHPQSGRPRLVAAGPSEPGVSGGAIWDRERSCVAGIASLFVPFSSLEDSKLTLEKAGNPPFTNFLIGILLPQ